MDGERFDVIVVALSTRRRTVLGGALAGAIGACLGRGDAAEAGPAPCRDPGATCKRQGDCCSGKCKKKKGKKKGKCRPCATECCVDADCAGRGACQGGACRCRISQRLCPDPDRCVDADDGCCGNADCPGTRSCGEDGFCHCPAGQYGCAVPCCDIGQACVGGACAACPAVDWCGSDALIRCGDGCACATSVDGVTTCADTDALFRGACDCGTDADCGAGRVCIGGGAVGFCDCVAANRGHCVPTGCPNP